MLRSLQACCPFHIWRFSPLVSTRQLLIPMPVLISLLLVPIAPLSFHHNHPPVPQTFPVKENPMFRWARSDSPRSGAILIADCFLSGIGLGLPLCYSTVSTSGMDVPETMKIIYLPEKISAEMHQPTERKEELTLP